MQHSHRKPTFHVFYRHGWVYLTVASRQDHASVVYPEEVRNRMRLLGMPQISTTRIRDAIAAAADDPVPLIEWPEGERLASRISVVVADDEMSAAVTISAPSRGASPPTVEDVAVQLAAAGVTFGVDRA
ncbi:MAG TPA: flagellar assembly protein A, partial [Alkalispirochaeta sp.]|nr:flagellar assembly protein A [Alkalispirochaeta sp.]